MNKFKPLGGIVFQLVRSTLRKTWAVSSRLNEMITVIIVIIIICIHRNEGI